jgi:hypothetical protein
MQQRAARSVTSQRGKAVTFSARPKAAGPPGLEAAFTENLTARIEYLYLKLENSTCTSTSACGNDPAPGGNPNETVKFSTSIIRLGVDYKFR